MYVRAAGASMEIPMPEEMPDVPPRVHVHELR
jgi:hypothetical protein